MAISIVIIDREHNAQILAKIFSSEDDFLIQGLAYSIEDGFDLIAKHQPDVVWFFNHIAQENWPQVCKDMTTQYPNIAVIVATTHGSNEDMNQARLAGAYVFLMSPYDANELFDTIRRASQR